MTNMPKQGRWCALVGAALFLSAGAAAAGEDPPARDILLHAEPQALTALELSLAVTKGAAPQRVTIEDLLVRIESVANVAIEDTLLLPNIDAYGRGSSVATVDLIGVVKGRALVARRLKCGPWAGDSLRCVSACDGSRIAVTRRLSHVDRSAPAGAPATPVLSLVIGRFDPSNERHLDGGIAFGACKAPDTPDARLLAKPGRLFVDIPLK